MAKPALMLTVGDREVRVSNPDKVYFPQVGLTKRDVVEYYIAVGESLLRAVGDRPTTMHRFVDGAEGESFYQKRMPKGAPDWIQSTSVTFPSGRTAMEYVPSDVASLAWAVNLGTIEMHPWPVRSADNDHPDELRIDLDPQPGTSFADAARAAVELRGLLHELGWTAYPKTSGGRGIHVLVRIRPEWTFVQVRRAVIAIGRELARRMPDAVTVAWWKEERGERIFIDYNQAARDRTVASAYSLRPTPTATASTPLTWEELPSVEPTDFTARTVPERLAKGIDPLAGIDSVAHDLTPALEMAARDERDHDLGDMPYPPDFPKMPGEPMRVQPSRAKARPEPE